MSRICRRRRQCRRRRPAIICLTGSIAMGKSETARLFRHLGVAVFDADAAVHQIQGPKGRALPLIEAAFPGTTGPGGVDRPALGKRVFGNPAALKRLEGIIHPMVAVMRRRFLAHYTRARVPAVVFDIPLLFEGRRTGTGACDLIVVASAPAFLQRRRALARPGMTEEKLNAILARQMPDWDKRRRADIIVPSGLGRRPALAAVRQALALSRCVKRRPKKSPG